MWVGEDVTGDMWMEEGWMGERCVLFSRWGGPGSLHSGECSVEVESMSLSGCVGDCIPGVGQLSDW